MVIKASSGKEVAALIADLASSGATTRDAAVARLTVVGSRAVARLIALAGEPNADATSRIGAFKALEHIADPRSLDMTFEAIHDREPQVSAAAIAVLGGVLQGPRGIEALDRLTAAALDETRPAVVRIAAARAIARLDRTTVGPVLAQLAADPDPAIAAEGAAARDLKEDGAAVLDAAVMGRLPDDPTELRRALAQRAAEIPVTDLHQIVEHIGRQESAESGARRVEWMAVRATAHVALAQRGSRLGIYDLRDTISHAHGPVAVEFLTAITEIGDATCLEPLAAAFVAASPNAKRADVWSRRHLADAFRTIVKREGVTKRQAAAKRVWTRFPDAAAELWP